MFINELSLPHCILFIMFKMLGFRIVGSLTQQDKCGCQSRPDLGRDKLGIRALGSLVSSQKNRSSRVLRNGRGTPLLFFLMLQDFRKIPFFLSFVLLVGSNWYLGETNSYLNFFTLFQIWVLLEYLKLKQQQQKEKKICPQKQIYFLDRKMWWQSYVG